jgi:hypothetical protein
MDSTEKVARKEAVGCRINACLCDKAEIVDNGTRIVEYRITGWKLITAGFRRLRMLPSSRAESAT